MQAENELNEDRLKSIAILSPNPTDIPFGNSTQGVWLKVVLNPTKVYNRINVVAEGLIPNQLNSILLHDVTGRLLYTGKIVSGSTGTAQIQLSVPLTSGLYIIKAIGEFGELQTKFVVE